MSIDHSSTVPELVILCGGKGQRLGTLTKSIPKPLLPVAGSPFLLRLIQQWKKEGIQKFILSTHHFADLFREFVDRYQDLRDVKIVEEPEAMGTGGGLRYAVEQAVSGGNVLVANGDSFVTEPLRGIWNYHLEGGYPFTLCAVKAGHVLGGATQKGRLVLNERDEMINFATEENSVDGWINGGIYAVSRREILSWPEGRFDLEKTILPNSEQHRVRVFKSTGNLLDIGIPSCYSLFDATLGPLENLFDSITVTSKDPSSN